MRDQGPGWHGLTVPDTPGEWFHTAAFTGNIHARTTEGVAVPANEAQWSLVPGREWV